MHVDTTETWGLACFDAHLQFGGICLANFDHREKVLIIGNGNTDQTEQVFTKCNVKQIGKIIIIGADTLY